MNDLNVYVGVGLLVAGVAGLVLFATYNTMRGVRGSLSNAKVGEVYNFDYEQPYHGESHRVLAKVIEPVYSLDDAAIRRLNRRSGYRRNDPVFQRTHHLVTCQTADGNIRQFYAERAKNVRRSLLGGVLIKTGVASLLF
jgi:hypothetical protein